MKHIFLLLFYLFAFYDITTVAQNFSGGDGSASNPYQITTKAQLLTVKNFSTSNFMLMNNIDFTGDPSYNAHIITSMNGNFNGSGHTISNIVLEGSISFFGVIASTSTVSNLHIRNISFTHNEYSGATARTQNQNHAPFVYANSGSIVNSSFVSSSTMGGYTNVSGFVLTNNGTIRNCYVNTDVSTIASYNISGTWFAGRSATGFVHTNTNTGVVENCYFIGSVNTGDYSTGAFALSNAGTIKNSFSLATSVVSPEYGSVVHRFVNSNSGILTNNFARAEMTLNGTPINNSNASSIEAKDVASVLLNQPATYTNEGWDFTNIWTFENGGALPIIRMTNISLPVTFGFLSAKSMNGLLMVTWSTATEDNCSHYNIEISKDGENFTKVSTIQSKAREGKSIVPLQYEYIVSLNSIALTFPMFVIIILSIPIGLSYKGCTIAKRRWLFLVFSTILGTLSIIIGCDKREDIITDRIENVYVRITQFDKDGAAYHSKIIKVIGE